MYCKIDGPIKLNQWLPLIILFIALFLLVIEIDLYQHTFIDFYIPLTIWILTGLLITPFLFRYYEKEGSKVKLPLQIMGNILCWGSIVLYSFMATNYYLIKEDYQYKTLPIISKGRMGSKGRDIPYIVVNFEGKEKQLIVSANSINDNYHLVKLKLAKGYFGYIVVKDQILIY